MSGMKTAEISTDLEPMLYSTERTLPHYHRKHFILAKRTLFVNKRKNANRNFVKSLIQFLTFGIPNQIPIEKFRRTFSKNIRLFYLRMM